MFLNQVTFQNKIEELSSAKRISMLDAILLYCSENDVEPEDITGLVSPALKDKIKVDAMNDGLLKREARLPI